MRSTFERDFERLADRVKLANPEQLLAMTCPGCNGPLEIQVSDGEKRKALSVMCKKCVCRVIFDGLSELPSWVDSLGPIVETAGQGAKPK